MIEVKTKHPIRYSNADGSKKQQRKEKRSERVQKARNVWQVGKDTGILSGVENLLMGNRGSGNQTNFGDQNLGGDEYKGGDENLPKKGWKGLKTWQKVAIIGTALAVAGGITYYVVKSRQAQ